MSKIGGFVGGFANESQGGSFTAGWVGGLVNGAIQGAAMKLIGPMVGAISGGTLGSFVGSAIMQGIDRKLGYNNLSNSEILTNSIKSAGFSFVTSILTGTIGWTTKSTLNSEFPTYIGGSAFDDGVSGVLFTSTIGDALDGFFGALDDALAYYLSGR